jgi:hypothetical protein
MYVGRRRAGLTGLLVASLLMTNGDYAQVLPYVDLCAVQCRVDRRARLAHVVVLKFIGHRRTPNGAATAAALPNSRPDQFNSTEIDSSLCE